MTLDPGFSTETSRELFGSENRLQSLLRVGEALALASGAAGAIPEASAAAIAAACRDIELDAEALFREGWEAGTPVIPLVAALRERVGREHAEAVHFGATTQDIIDTGLMLQMRQGLDALVRDARTLGELLASLAREHRGTRRLARTLLQPSAATTFGFTAARWLDALTRDLDRLTRRRSGRALQLGGAVGDLAVLGDHAETIGVDMAGRLDLEAPAVPWHASRDRVESVASSLSLYCRTASKIAGDLLLLSSADIGEVTMRAGGSSAMPGKRNAIDAVRAVAAARFAIGQATTLLSGPAHELERAAGGWHLEWAVVPQLFHGALAAGEALEQALRTLEVDADRMTANLELLSSGSDPGTRTDALIDAALRLWESATS